MMDARTCDLLRDIGRSIERIADDASDWRSALRAVGETIQEKAREAYLALPAECDDENEEYAVC